MRVNDDAFLNLDRQFRGTPLDVSGAGPAPHAKTPRIGESILARHVREGAPPRVPGAIAVRGNAARFSCLWCMSHDSH